MTKINLTKFTVCSGTLFNHSAKIKSVSNKKARNLIDDFLKSYNSNMDFSFHIKDMPYGLNGIIYEIYRCACGAEKEEIFDAGSSSENVLSITNEDQLVLVDDNKIINGENLIMRLPNPNGSGMLNQNSGPIENWGAEAAVDWTLNHMWSVTANYSWLHMENPVLASPRHKLYGGVNFGLGRWNASTGVQM